MGNFIKIMFFFIVPLMPVTSFWHDQLPIGEGMYVGSQADCSL